MHNFSDSLDMEANRVTKSSINTDLFSITLSAPGKVILFGEHSVVYGKLALAASLGLRTKLCFNEREHSEIGNDKININLHAVNIAHCYALQDLKQNLMEKNREVSKHITLEKPEVANHEHLLEVIVDFIKKNSGSIPLSQSQHQALVSLFFLLVTMIGSSKVELNPFDLTMETDLTINAGLGSSASYMVTLAAAFFEYVKFKTSKNNVNRAKNTKSFSKKDLDLISRWAYSAEKIIHGTPSGLDNAICTFGSVVEFRKNSPLKPVEFHRKLQVLLVNTKVPKDTKALVAKVAQLKQSYPAIVHNILSAMENVSTLALQDLSKLDEIAKSTKMKEDQSKIVEVHGHLGDLVDFNQNLLRSLKVSHPFLDDICAVLAEEGLHGKLTGAGGGGYAFAIVPTGFSESILHGVVKTLESRGYETVLTDLGGPGLVFG